MKHLYAIEVTELPQNGESSAPENRLQFEFLSHDDLLEITAKVQQKQLFSEEQAKLFCVGIKLFSSVLLENRKHPLFAEFAPHFGEFMKKLKK
jgi:hypothetical protein